MIHRNHLGEALPRPSDLAHHWDLDPGTVFLNHGSFGATPRRIMGVQSAWRSLLEADPVRFFVEQHASVMDETRRVLAAFVGCQWDCLALVPNATIGVATVFANITLRPGDEVLISSHEYPACQNAVRRAAAKAGANVVAAALPLPCPGPKAVIDTVLGAVTARTRVALLSHVTSPSALVLPVEELTRVLRARGILVVVDGAHAPGMLPGLSIAAIDPDFYTANCHKWLCTPKGSALLYVRPELREGFRPLALSNNAERPRPGRPQFLTEFDYVGTQDCTAFYCIPDALGLLGALLPGGFPEVMHRNHGLVVRARALLCESLGVSAPAPEAMLGSIATIELPPHPPGVQARVLARPTKYHDALADNLLDKWRIQVPVWSVAGSPHRTLRISAQVYNALEQYEYLARALKQELAEERELA